MIANQTGLNKFSKGLVKTKKSPTRIRDFFMNYNVVR